MTPVVAIVPARGGSKGIANKNKRLLCGKPLVSYPILAAKDATLVDRIICSTDDVEIAEIARIWGAEVPRMRPPSLATDESSTIDVLIDVLTHDDTESDTVLLLEPTSPLTTSSDVDRALQKFMQAENADSLISVSPSVSGHPQFTFCINSDSTVESILGGKWQFKRRQELSNLYFQDGSLYISSRLNILTKKSFVVENTLGYVMPKLKSFEIDDEVDWCIIECLIQKLAGCQNE